MNKLAWHHVVGLLITCHVTTTPLIHSFPPSEYPFHFRASSSRWREGQLVGTSSGAVGYSWQASGTRYLELHSSHSARTSYCLTGFQLHFLLNADVWCPAVHLWSSSNKKCSNEL